MIGTIYSLRDYGPGAAFASLSDPVLTAYLGAASAFVSSYLRERGYDAEVATYGPDLEFAVYRIATWDLMVGVRGVNPADPAHAALAKNRDDAVMWLRDVAKGVANLAGAAPARRAQAVASVVSTTGEPTRGW